MELSSVARNITNRANTIEEMFKVFSAQHSASVDDTSSVGDAADQGRSSGYYVTARMFDRDADLIIGIINVTDDSLVKVLDTDVVHLTVRQESHCRYDGKEYRTRGNDVMILQETVDEDSMATIVIRRGWMLPIPFSQW